MNRCESARRWMHERLDGDISASDALDLDAHLRECAECREIAAGLDGVVLGFGNLPLETMPDDDLANVLRRTVGAAHDMSMSDETNPAANEADRRSSEARGRLVRPHRWRIRSAYVIAAAAMLAAIAIVPFAFRQSAPPEPSAAEVETAAQEARMVLALASRAVRSAESTARKRVIADEVAPALKHVPVRWHRDSAPRRNGV